MLFVAMYPWYLGAATDLDGFHGFHLFCMSGSKQASIERSRGFVDVQKSQVVSPHVQDSGDTMNLRSRL